MSATGFGGTSQHRRTASWAGIDLGATGFLVPLSGLHALALALTLEAIVATEKPPPFVATESAAPDRAVHQSSRGRVARLFWGGVPFFLTAAAPRALSPCGATRSTVWGER